MEAANIEIFDSFTDGKEDSDNFSVLDRHVEGVIVYYTEGDSDRALEGGKTLL